MHRSPYDQTYFVEQLDKVQVRRVGTEVLLQQPVDGGLEEERVVNGDKTDALVSVPTWLSSPRDARVHEVVGHEEECLQLGHREENSK